MAERLEGRQGGVLLEVGLGEWAVARRREVLAAYGLGSCVGLVLFASPELVALAHVVLPHAREDLERPARYADTVVPFLLQAMGVGAEDVGAYLVGGAAMFPEAHLPDIGAENVRVLVEELARRHVAVLGQDVGGRFGRTVRVLGDQLSVTAAGGREHQVRLLAPAKGGSRGGAGTSL